MTKGTFSTKNAQVGNKAYPCNTINTFIHINTQLQGLLLTRNDKADKACHGNTGRDAEIHHEWDAGPSQGTMHTLIHI